MFSLALLLLTGTAMLGSAAAVLFLNGKAAALRLRVVAPLHGLLGGAGLIVLLLALRGPPRGEGLGVAGFGQIAAVLLGMALLLGGTILLRRLLNRHLTDLIVGLHATIAIAGIVILAAYVLVD